MRLNYQNNLDIWANKNLNTKERQAPEQSYVNNVFSNITGHYDQMNTIMTLGMHHLWKSKLIKIVSKNNPQLCIDIATGTGDISRKLSMVPSVKQLLSTDILPDMLKLAITKSKSSKTNNKHSYFASTAINLPIKSNIADVVTAGFSLRNMPDLEQAISEMARVTKSGGIVSTLELTPYKTRIIGKLIGLYFNSIVPIIGTLISNNREAYSYLPKSVDNFIDAEQLKTLFEKCGLQKVKYTKLGMGTIAIHTGYKP